MLARHSHVIRALLIAIPLALLAMPAAHAQAPRHLALVGGMLLDGYDAPAIHHAAIVIEGNKIVQVGPAREITIPPDATVIDTSGLTMMPGMMEMHAHLAIMGHGEYGRWFAWLAQHKAQFPPERVFEISAKHLLMAGITSAIDLGGSMAPSLAVRDRIARGDIPGPRMLVSGPPINHRRGAANPGNPDNLLGPGVGITSPAEAAAAVEEHVRQGVDVIKCQTPLSYDEYVAIVEAAHKHNVRVHAHLYTERELADAFHAGVDVLQHVGSAGVPLYSPALVKEIVDAGRPVVPTAAHRVFVWPATIEFPERLQNREMKKYTPPEIWAEIQDSLKDFRSLRYFNTTDRQMFFADADMKQWIESGAVVGMGTDSGTPMNSHLEALWREAKSFVDHGMSPQRVISALTRVNARIYGKPNDLGTIEVGKLADVIVVNGDPLFDITALSHVETVVKDGVVWKKDGVFVDASPRRGSNQARRR
jgi:imidazolonepropionase-like amidohydrolase